MATIPTLPALVVASNVRFLELSARYSCECQSFVCSHAKAARAEARRVMAAERLNQEGWG